MVKVENISYTEWALLVNNTKKKGRQCDEFQLLRYCYPQSAGDSYKHLIKKELTELETVLLKNAVKKYQCLMNICLEEADLEIAASAMRKLKKDIKDCLFFKKNQGYPESVKEEIMSEIERNLMLFQSEFRRFVQNSAQNNNNDFIQDMLYLCNKRNFAKILRECEENA